jgi:hypothetical protein
MQQTHELEPLVKNAVGTVQCVRSTAPRCPPKSSCVVEVSREVQRERIKPKHQTLVELVTSSQQMKENNHVIFAIL